MNAKPLAHWHARIAPQLLPRSEEQSIVERALDEWVYGRECVDYGLAEETCELCLQKGLRYHFLIGNEATSHRLQVGSECVTRFDLGVLDLDTSQIVHGAEGRKLVSVDLRRLEEAARVKRLHDLVDRALAAEPGDSYWEQLRPLLGEKKALSSPARLAYLLISLSRLGLPLPAPGDVSVSTRREVHEIDLAYLSKACWELVSPYLTKLQREYGEARREARREALRNPPPPPPAVEDDDDDFDELMRGYWSTPGASFAGSVDFLDSLSR